MRDEHYLSHKGALVPGGRLEASEDTWVTLDTARPERGGKHV